MIKCGRQLAALSVILSFSLASYAADVQTYGVGKGQVYYQIDTNAPSLPLGYIFDAFVDLSPASNLVTSATVKLPNNSVSNLVATPDGTEWDLVGTFFSQPSLDSAFPNGNYVLTMNTVHDGTRTVTNSLVADSYPAGAPRVSNFDAAQMVNAANNFLLTWDAFAGGASTDLIRVQLMNDLNELVFATPRKPGAPGALNGTNTSVLIPAGTLASGQTYQGDIVFFKLTFMNTNVYPGAVGIGTYFKQTHFTLATAVGGAILSEPAHTAASTFQFRLTGTAGQNYTIQAATNMSASPGWFTVFVTNAPANSFIVVDPGATNSRRYYRAFN
jgi:hypothetical protein